jgi:hypothetical protein
MYAYHGEYKTVNHVEWMKEIERRLKKKKTAEEGYTFQPKLYPYVPPKSLPAQAIPNGEKNKSKHTEEKEEDDVDKVDYREAEARAIARANALFLNASIREEKK